MPPDRKQISVWINTDSAALLSSIAKEQGVSLARIIELAVAAYSTSDRTSEKTSGYTSDLTSRQLVDSGWRAVTEELRELIADQEVRLNRIETAILSGLGGRDAMVRVSIEAADSEAVGAIDDTLPHPADHLFPTAQEAKIQYERQLDERIVDLKNKGLGIKKIQAELGIGQKRVYKGLESAGLVE